MKPQGVQKNDARIDVDGLPHVGAVVYPSQSYYSKVDCATGERLYDILLSVKKSLPDIEEKSSARNCMFCTDQHRQGFRGSFVPCFFGLRMPQVAESSQR